MDRYDICIAAVPGDAKQAQALRDSILHYRLPKGVALHAGEAYAHTAKDAPAEQTAGEAADDARSSGEKGQEYRRIAMDVTGSDLNEAVRALLDESRFLLLLVSPKTKDCEGMRDRLDYFRGRRGGDHVVVVLLEGEPEESFPVSLYEEKLVRHIMPDLSVVEQMEKIEPVAADLRGDTASRRSEALQYETVRIVAAVLGIHPDVLMQRHRARRRRAVLAGLAVAGAVSLAAAGIFLRLGLIAKREGDIAREQTRLSVQIVERTLLDLPVLFEGDEAAMAYVEEAMESARESLRELGLDALLSEDPADPAEKAGAAP